jgi:nucleoside-diphosphate-sugar epimerase
VKRIIVTGSSGLIGSEAVAFFDQLGWDVRSVDNNMRRSFFGPDLERLRRVDASLHSVFGASKLAADVMVQEYGRYFGMPTVCFRGGCLTGPHHSAAELHGFLAYLARAVKEGRVYRVYGYKGKQVRDNLHSYDVCAAFLEFYRAPRSAAVYNLRGGRANSVSILEAIERCRRAPYSVRD